MGSNVAKKQAHWRSNPGCVYFENAFNFLEKLNPVLWQFLVQYVVTFCVDSALTRQRNSSIWHQGKCEWYHDWWIFLLDQYFSQIILKSSKKRLFQTSSLCLITIYDQLHVPQKDALNLIFGEEFLSIFGLFRLKLLL